MEIIALRCPLSGDNLAGLSNDVVFQCPRCKTALEIDGKTFQQRDLSFALPRHIRDEPVYMLPFWKFEVQYNLVGEFDSKFKKLDALEKIRHVYVTAFFQRDIYYFGDMGLIYTQAGIDYQKSQGDHRLLGASRTLKEAAAYVRLFILKIMDQAADVTGVDVDVTAARAEIVGFPFYDLGNKLVDGILGMELPSVCLDDLNEMREFRG
jgi:hypothetical protein